MAHTRTQSRLVFVQLPRLVTTPAKRSSPTTTMFAAERAALDRVDLRS
jgi:hypothetical protein